MASDIELICRDKENELLKKYFGNLIREASIERPETIGEYTVDLPLKIEAEFRVFLENLWRQYSDEPLVLEEQKLRRLLTEDDREGIEEAYKDATTITLWERITRSNHEDVTHYKGLLHEFTRELLIVMRIDFLEEITGHIINCKTFEED